MIINFTENIIDKLYKVKDKDVFEKVKKINENVKVIIATNHVSYIKKFINKYLNINYLDEY